MKLPVEMKKDGDDEDLLCFPFQGVKDSYARKTQRSGAMVLYPRSSRWATRLDQTQKPNR